MKTPFKNFTDQPGDPAKRIFEITPDDDAELPIATKAIRAGMDGTIRLQAVASDDPVDHPVLEGERIDAVVSKVFETGTTPGMTVIGYA
jgi:hypothetical protein